MARATRALIAALRQTAERLASDATYQWGHMGMCNCGHLAQSITGLRQAEIHDSALIREGDWEQQAKDYCPTSGHLIDSILAAMFDLGLTRDDVRHLEKLSDPEVIRTIGRHLRFNKRDDVVIYLRTWAALLSGGQPTPAVRAAGTAEVGCPPSRLDPALVSRNGNGRERGADDQNQEHVVEEVGIDR